ncbi:unnamed protein product [Ambrosiozyma monospora]|nr:unnamed protein product [Ambrosiozyma monospora]
MDAYNYGPLADEYFNLEEFFKIANNGNILNEMVNDYRVTDEGITVAKGDVIIKATNGFIEMLWLDVEKKIEAAKMSIMIWFWETCSKFRTDC